MKYANVEINFTPERLVDIATKAIHKLLEVDEDSAREFFEEEMQLTDYERDFFDTEENDYFEDLISIEEEPWDYEDRNYERTYHDDDFDDSAAWEDDSDRGCKDCPPDECHGHCMSCYYRSV